MPKKRIPDFESEEDEMEFWDTHNSADYWDDTEPVEGVTFPKPRLKQISLRIAPTQIERLKKLAATKGIGYQTMIRIWITERLATEARPTGRPETHWSAAAAKPVARKVRRAAKSS